MEKIYTIDEIKRMTYDIFKKYGVDKAYIFGSYARGEANIDSDIDIIIKKGKLSTLLQLSALAIEIETLLNKEIDIITEETYTKQIENIKNKSDDILLKIKKNFYKRILKERVILYEQS